MPCTPTNYTKEQIQARIAHIGLGAFPRSHMALGHSRTPSNRKQRLGHLRPVAAGPPQLPADHTKPGRKRLPLPARHSKLARNDSLGNRQHYRSRRYGEWKVGPWCRLASTVLRHRNGLEYPFPGSFLYLTICSIARRGLMSRLLSSI